MVHWVTTSDNEWQWVRTSGTTIDNEWQSVLQRMIASGTTSYNEWQRIRKNDKEWERVTTNDNEWQRVAASGTTNENRTVHFKEWIIAIFSMTKTDTLLQGIDGYN